jgi:hypothetical protein
MDYKQLYKKYINNAALANVTPFAFEVFVEIIKTGEGVKKAGEAIIKATVNPEKSDTKKKKGRPKKWA